MPVKEHKRKRKSGAGGMPATHGPEEAAQARGRILDAAETEFARKGFDGARVDEIAAAAGVNKALIYYYFKSKKALLDELIERLLLLVAAEKETVYTILRPEDAEFTEAMIRRVTKTMRERIRILTVLSMEALKDDNRMPAVFRVIDRMLETSVAQVESHGYSAAGVEEWRVPAFFFGSLPLAFFVLLKDKWIAHYKVDGKELEDEFFRTFLSMHRSWALGLFKKKK